MWSLFNLTIGFKFYFGKICLEKDPKGSAPSRVEITEKFRDLSVLYQYLSSELEKGQEFRIEIFDGKETIKINSSDIDFIKRTTNKENILVEIELKYNDQLVTITNASTVSIVYVEAKPTKPRLDANAGEVQYASETIGSRLQKIFPNVNTLEIELMESGELEKLPIGPNSSAVLVIVERDTLANSISTIELEKFFQIKIENQYQGTNLPNVWVLPTRDVKQITAVGRQNFIRVKWVDGNSSDSRKIVFPLSEYRFFVIKEQSTTASPDQSRKSTAAAKPGSAKVLAKPAKPKIVTLRDVLTNLPDSKIEITNLCENPECNLTSRMKYYLVIVENSLLKRVQRSSSILDLKLNFSSGKISQGCNVVPLYSITGVGVGYSNNRPFGISVSWYDRGSQKNMVYPIRDYRFYLIGIPNSDNDLLAQLLQNPPGTPTVVDVKQLESVVEQLKSAIKVAFGKN